MKSRGGDNSEPDKKEEEKEVTRPLRSVCKKAILEKSDDFQAGSVLAIALLALVFASSEC
jgi:hypothetical protein